MALRNTNGKYMTKNLYLAAYLQVLGYDVVLQDESNERFTFWVVIDEKLENLVDKFYSNEAEVEPIAFSIALKELKKKMYDR